MFTVWCLQREPATLWQRKEFGGPGGALSPPAHVLFLFKKTDEDHPGAMRLSPAPPAPRPPWAAQYLYACRALSSLRAPSYGNMSSYSMRRPFAPRARNRGSICGEKGAVMKKGLPDRRDACVACGLPVSDGLQRTAADARTPCKALPWNVCCVTMN